jgi:hypothetical protein
LLITWNKKDRTYFSPRKRQNKSRAGKRLRKIVGTYNKSIGRQEHFNKIKSLGAKLVANFSYGASSRKKKQ